ncbi:hypothetical protein EVAR_48306_1 [Eumeta japonica]|uniref:Uncharacterized protein n=1 Tax=Eumeta variegata TaxID=151549 RepID=A0A4C1WKZ1_EUMVA|nr:hypothetical protein EVAR_48306_1 [Eumeta japonica]
MRTTNITAKRIKSVRSYHKKNRLSVQKYGCSCYGIMNRTEKHANESSRTVRYHTLIEKRREISVVALRPASERSRGLYLLYYFTPLSIGSLPLHQIFYSYPKGRYHSDFAEDTSVNGRWQLSTLSDFISASERQVALTGEYKTSAAISSACAINGRRGTVARRQRVTSPRADAATAPSARYGKITNNT